MVRTVSIDDLDIRLLFDIVGSKDPAVEDNGKLLGVVLNADTWERYREFIWERGWAAVDELRQLNAHLDPEEVHDLVTQVVEEVRQEHYDQRNRQT